MNNSDVIWVNLKVLAKLEPFQKLNKNEGGTKLSIVDRHIKKDLDTYFKQKKHSKSIFDGWF